MTRRPVISYLVLALAAGAIGISIGLYVAWELWPVQFTNADPADLRLAYKDDYIRMISARYQLTGDLAAARQRLSRLQLGVPAGVVNDLIARERKTGGGRPVQASLLALAQALATPQAVQRPTQTRVRPTQVAQAQATATLLEVTPVPTIPSFQVVGNTRLGCADEPAEAHLRFLVRDSHGRDLPNIPIEIRWSNGDDTVYTGLKPEHGIGYADFEAAPGSYSVTILNAQGDSATNLLIAEPPANCRSDRGSSPRGWRLVFQLN